MKYKKEGCDQAPCVGRVVDPGLLDVGGLQSDQGRGQEVGRHVVDREPGETVQFSQFQMVRLTDMSQNVLDLIIAQLGGFNGFQPDDGLGQKNGGQVVKK